MEDRSANVHLRSGIAGLGREHRQRLIDGGPGAVGQHLGRELAHLLPPSALERVLRERQPVL